MVIQAQTRETAPVSAMHRCARDLAARGWPIFPCVPGKKRPLTENGCLDATTDPTQIDAWWRWCPTANIGLATGGRKGLLIVDIDLDTTKKKDGYTTWAALVEKHAPGTHPGLGTLTVVTPRGGRHLYLRTHHQTACRNTNSSLAHGVDTRGNGGYACVPPSHTNAGVYTRAVAAPIRDAPDWLVDLLEPAQRRSDGETLVFVPPATTDRYAAAAINGEMERVKNAPSGTRNHTVFVSAIALGQLVGGGALTETDAETALLTAASVHIGVDGFTQAEAHATIRSGLARGIAEPRTITPKQEAN